MAQNLILEAQQLRSEVTETQLARLSQLHPDERAWRITGELARAVIDQLGVEERRGLGHVLPDGVWFDPVDGVFFALETVP